jgi:hypothetical protein
MIKNSCSNMTAYYVSCNTFSTAQHLKSRVSNCSSISLHICKTTLDLTVFLSPPPGPLLLSIFLPVTRREHIIGQSFVIQSAVHCVGRCHNWQQVLPNWQATPMGVRVTQNAVIWKSQWSFFLEQEATVRSHERGLWNTKSILHVDINLLNVSAKLLSQPPLRPDALYSNTVPH